jgi:hypothetical protein
MSTSELSTVVCWLSTILPIFTLASFGVRDFKLPTADSLANERTSHITGAVRHS